MERGRRGELMIVTNINYIIVVFIWTYIYIYVFIHSYIHPFISNVFQVQTAFPTQPQHLHLVEVVSSPTSFHASVAWFKDLKPNNPTGTNKPIKRSKDVWYITTPHLSHDDNFVYFYIIQNMGVFFCFDSFPAVFFWSIQDTSSPVEVPSMLALVVTQYLHHASRGPRQLLGDQKGKSHLLWLNIPTWWGKNNNYLNWCLWIYLPLIKKNNQNEKTKRQRQIVRIKAAEARSFLCISNSSTVSNCKGSLHRTALPRRKRKRLKQKRGRDKGTSKKKAVIRRENKRCYMVLCFKMMGDISGCIGGPLPECLIRQSYTLPFHTKNQTLLDRVSLPTLRLFGSAGQATQVRSPLHLHEDILHTTEATPLSRGIGGFKGFIGRS